MSLDTVEVKGLIEASLIDWPGKVATVIFLPGCNLRCRYCHARDIVLPGAPMDSISLDRTLDFVARKQGWIDGVVISGGEPTLHGELPAIAARMKSLGLAVKLDTNGTRPRVIERLIADRLLDAVSMDVKAPLDHRYFEVARRTVSLPDLRDSIAAIMGSDLDYEFRTTVSPFLHSPSDIAEIARALSGAKRYTLQPFHPHVCLDRTLESHPPCPPSFLEDAARLAAPFVDSIAVRRH